MENCPFCGSKLICPTCGIPESEVRRVLEEIENEMAREQLDGDSGGERVEALDFAADKIRSVLK